MPGSAPAAWRTAIMVPFTLRKSGALIIIPSGEQPFGTASSAPEGPDALHCEPSPNHIDSGDFFLTPCY
jgi:hypothetical protein